MAKSKALYRPKGRSGEYSQWAINFYNGCKGNCAYCYNQRFPILSGTAPTLKACFDDEAHALKVAVNEIQQNAKEIEQDGGLFLSFVSDPCLPETIDLTFSVIRECLLSPEILLQTNGAIPVKVLTKQAGWVLNCAEDNAAFLPFDESVSGTGLRKNVAFGFTLTGHDELEPGCSSNADRLRAMKILHEKGYRTWASIEPVIDFRSSLEMIRACVPFCDHFKVGLRTGRKFTCTQDELVSFVNGIRETVSRTGSSVYFKRSIRDLVGGKYFFGVNFVEEGFDLFKEK